MKKIILLFMLFISQQCFASTDIENYKQIHTQIGIDKVFNSFSGSYSKIFENTATREKYLSIESDFQKSLTNNKYWDIKVDLVGKIKTPNCKSDIYCMNIREIIISIYQNYYFWNNYDIVSSQSYWKIFFMISKVWNISYFYDKINWNTELNTIKRFSKIINEDLIKKIKKDINYTKNIDIKIQIIWNRDKKDWDINYELLWTYQIEYTTITLNKYLEDDIVKQVFTSEFIHMLDYNNRKKEYIDSFDSEVFDYWNVIKNDWYCYFNTDHTEDFFNFMLNIKNNTYNNTKNIMWESAWDINTLVSVSLIKKYPNLFIDIFEILGKWTYKWKKIPSDLDKLLKSNKKMESTYSTIWYLISKYENKKIDNVNTYKKVYTDYLYNNKKEILEIN